MAYHICISNQKGGVAKTTTAVNLAAGLAKYEQDALLIDMDPQASATIHFGFRPRDMEATVADALRGTRGFRAVIQEVNSYLSLAPSNGKLTQVGHALSMYDDGYKQLLTRMDTGDYDYVIIDTGPAIDMLTKNAIFASEWLIVPIEADYLSLEGLASLWETIDEFKKESSAEADILGILIAQVDHRLLRFQSTIASESIQLIRQEFGKRVFQTTIRETVRLKEAPSYGKSIIDYAPDSPATDEYLALAKEVIARCRND